MDRSENMRRIRAVNTRPELAVRTALRSIGLRGYRLHRKELPGKPDIAFVGRRKAILVHGCFWHGHSCKEGSRSPKSNTGYWSEKIRLNQERDVRHFQALIEMGWSVLTIWDCEIADKAALADRLKRFVNAP